jgi:hypothetical protein
MRRSDYDDDCDYDYDDDGEEGICEACGEACRAVQVDCGIGPYEFWGAPGIHHDWRALSPCCESEVIPGGAKVVSDKVVTARKDHTVRDYRGVASVVHPGEQYRRTVTHHWREGGPGWYTVTKKLI